MRLLKSGKCDGERILEKPAGFRAYGPQAVAQRYAALIMAFRTIRGLEYWLADVILYEDETKELIGIITELILECIKILGKAGLDGVAMFNDWGTQTASLT